MRGAVPGDTAAIDAQGPYINVDKWYVKLGAPD